jgi:ABC-type phosphate transport system substrate-binding protein
MTLVRSILLCVLILLGAVAGAQSIVVIVNPTSGVASLTRYQAVDIFLGRYRKLPSGLAALPIDLGPGDADRATFYSLLVHKSPADMSSYWARLVFSGQASPPFLAPDAKTALDLVASNPNAIAYVDAGLVDRRVRVVLELTK